MRLDLTELERALLLELIDYRLLDNGRHRQVAAMRPRGPNFKTRAIQALRDKLTGREIT